MSAIGTDITKGMRYLIASTKGFDPEALVYTAHPLPNGECMIRMIRPDKRWYEFVVPALEGAA